MSQKPNIVLLPGLDGTGELFGPIIPFLEKACTVSIVRYANLNSFEGIVSHTESQLPKVASFSLVAESFSGPVAISLLARRKFNFEPSVLCATFSKCPFHLLTELAKYLPEKMFDLEAANRVALDIFGIDKSTSPEIKEMVMSALEKIGPGAIKNRVMILNETNVSDLISDVETPMLYIQASRDRIVSNASEQKLISNFQDIKTSKIEGPHLLLQSKPEECANLIIEHVTSNKRMQSDPAKLGR